MTLTVEAHGWAPWRNEVAVNLALCPGSLHVVCGLVRGGEDSSCQRAWSNVSVYGRPDRTPQRTLRHASGKVCSVLTAATPPSLKSVGIW